MDHIGKLFNLEGHSMPERFQVPFVNFKAHCEPLPEAGVVYGCQDLFGLTHLRGSDPDTFCKVLQSWFYFGLLREFFPIEFNIDDFKKVSDGHQVVSSECLLRYCSLYSGDRERHIHLHDCLEFVKTWTDEIDLDCPLESSNSLLGPITIPDSIVHQKSRLIIASIKVLLETMFEYLRLSCSDRCTGKSKAQDVLTSRVNRVLTNLFYPGDSLQGINYDTVPSATVSGGQKRPVYGSVPASFFFGILLNNGWCRRHLTRMKHELNSTCLYILASRDSELVISQKGNHMECSASVCQQDENAGDTGPKHSFHCYGGSLNINCKPLQVDTRKLESIYEDSKSTSIPIVSFADGEATIEESRDQKYFAVSHVWSEGLGNASSNSIHSCQLQDLAGLIEPGRRGNSSQDSWGPMKFWLDTLCIPKASGRSSPDREVLEASAIKSIDWAFASAHCVLIRDLTIQNPSLPFSSLDPLLQIMHLYNMRWLSRCWTLAEAISAWKIKITVGGKTQSLFDLIIDVGSSFARRYSLASEPQSSTATSFRNELMSSVFRSFVSPFDVFIDSKDGHQDIIATWNALLQRSTKKASDVPTILAIANAISLKNVVDCKEKTMAVQMKLVLNAFRRLPAAFLFQDGPKINEPLNRWVPAEPPYSGGSARKQRILPRSTYRVITDNIESTVLTYAEGKAVGPLQSSQSSPVYLFKGPLTQSFYLEVQGQSQFFFVEMAHQIQNHNQDNEYCLILSSVAGLNGPSISTAFCATVMKMTETESKLLVTWETVAQVRKVAQETPGGLRSRALYNTSVYVSCDMTTWPVPRLLRHAFSAQQERFIIRQRGQMITLCYVSLALMSICFMLSLLDTAIPYNLIPAFIPISLLGSSAWMCAKRFRKSTPSTETQTRTHEMWRSLFLLPPNIGSETLFQRYKDLVLKASTWSMLRFPRLERAVFSIELALCTIAAVLAAYLAVKNRDVPWCLAPLVCAWLSFLVMPVIWAYWTIFKPETIYLSAASCCFLAFCSSFTLAPLLDDDASLTKTDQIICWVLFVILVIHLAFIVLSFAKWIASVILNEAQKSPATLESIFLIEDDDSWHTIVLRKSLICALQRSPYKFLSAWVLPSKDSLLS